MKIQYKLSNGSWTDAEQKDNALFMPWLMEKTITYQNATGLSDVANVDDIMEYLSTGKTLQYGSDWYQTLRDADSQSKPREIVETLCQCGHYTSNPMTSSRGTCCADCYDELSL
jgi:hypothetical protein